MNRFDTSTIWNSDPDKVADVGAEESPGDATAATGSGAFDSDAGLDEAALTAATQEAGEPTSSWTPAVRAQTFFVPLHYEQNYRYPLIVWLHSDGFNENQVCHVMPHVSSRNYLATGIRAPMASDASGHRFQWTDSAASLHSAERSVLAAIDSAANQYSVNAQRIVLAGYQRGGTMAMRIAMQHPEMFAAAISLGGAFELPCEGKLDRQRLRERRLPMLWQCSLQSEQYDESRLAGEIEAAHSIAARLEVRQYRNDDEMNTAVLRDLDRWIMNHVVSGSPVAKMNRWDTSPTSFSDN